MSTFLEYTISLKDLVSSKLSKIIVTNDTMLKKWAEVEQKAHSVNRTFADMGTSVYSLTKKIDLLKSERDLLPISSLSAIRKYNSEINRLGQQVTKLQTPNGNKVKTWFKDALNGLPGIATNPLMSLGSSIGAVVKKGMEADMQRANILTLVGGNVEKAKALYSQLSDYSIKTPYEKADLIEAQKTMMSFGLSSEAAFNKLKNIGDIALGDKNKIQSLSLAFAQAMSTGKLQEQSYLQMANAGFDPLNEISKKTGESMAVLKNRMAKGGISAKELSQAFESVTQKGGQFYQGAEKAGQTLGSKWSNMMDSFSELALKVYDLISPIIMPLVQGVTSAVEKVGTGIEWLVNKFKEGNPYVIAIASAVAIFATALLLHNAYTSVAAFFQNQLTLAVLKTNLAFLANPVTWVIAGIIALIAAIAYVIYKTDGWGNAWKHTVNGAKLLWQAFVEHNKLGFDTMVNGFMIGLNVIKKAWYQFKNTLGLGDKNENDAALAKIDADTKSRVTAIAQGGKKVGALYTQSFDEFKKAGGSLKWNNERSLSGLTTEIKGKLGISDSNYTSPVTGGESLKTTPINPVKNTTDSIAGGGAKATNITINMGKMQDQIVINTMNTGEGATKMRQILEEELNRLLGSVAAMQTA